VDLEFPNSIAPISALLIAVIVVITIKGLIAYAAITVLKALWYIFISVYDAFHHLRNGAAIEDSMPARSSPEGAIPGSIVEATDPEMRKRYARAIADRRDRERNLKIFGLIGTVLLVTVAGFVVLGIVAMNTSPAAP